MKRVSVAALLAMVLGLWGLHGASAQAACTQDGSARTTDDESTPENEDTPDEVAGPAGPSNSTVYVDPAVKDGGEPNYAGIAGNTGYLEGDGNNGSIVEAEMYGSTVNGRVGSEPSACVADTQITP